MFESVLSITQNDQNNTHKEQCQWKYIHFIEEY